jgi:hypothetical protein
MDSLLLELMLLAKKEAEEGLAARELLLRGSCSAVAAGGARARPRAPGLLLR